MRWCIWDPKIIEWKYYIGTLERNLWFRANTVLTFRREEHINNKEWRDQIAVMRTNLRAPKEVIKGMRIL